MSTSKPDTVPPTTSQAALSYAELGRPVLSGAIRHNGRFADMPELREDERMTEPAERTAPTVTAPPWNPAEFTRLMRELAVTEAPRLFAIVEEYGEAEDARVAGYGLSYQDRVEANSVEGGFRLNSESVESTRTLFEISSRSAGVRRVHVVWVDQTAGDSPQD